MRASISFRGTWPRRLHRAPVALVLALAVLAGCNRSDEPVVFGLAGPFRTPYGASMRLGAELAAKEINAENGIRGRRLVLRAADDAENPDSAYRAADGFFNDPEVVAVVGHVNSSTTVHAASVYQRGLPAVATSATSPEISRLGEWVFRVASSDSSNAVELARLARRIDRPTAVLYQNEDYGRGLARSFQTAFLASGGRVLESDPYLSSTADLTPFLARMRERGVKLVFLAGLEEDAARIIRQARAVGLDARFVGGDGVEGLVNMGSDFDGTLVGLLYHADSSPQARDFAKRFRAAYQREPDSFAALAYDATRLLARAARQEGAKRESIQRFLAEVGSDPEANPAFEGVTGRIRFDANGDPTDKGFAVGVIRGGKIIPNSEF